MHWSPRARPALLLPLLFPLLAAAGCGPGATPAGPTPRAVAPLLDQPALVPLPASMQLNGGAPFTLGAGTAIHVPASDSVATIAEFLAGVLRPSTGLAMPVVRGGAAPAGAIALTLGGAAELGEEGYRLVVHAGGVSLSAPRPAGLFRGVQTLRQLFPPAVEAHLSALNPGPWTLPALTIEDRPRFAWRGAMLDVARHFFTVHEVKQYIDALALYKINVLHLHLSDDQGWRLEIRSHPRLTELGGATRVGGGDGGFYTQAEYQEIVRHAASRFMTVVPEIDLPAHTNAMLLGYPELSCGKRAPAPYTGTEVGFSAICPEDERSYRLIEEVLLEVASLTPGPYLHIGGDEVEALTPAQYISFIERVQGIVAGLGKRMVGWEEVGKARLLPSSLVQQWKSDSATAALRSGSRLILSPANRAYLDMKYDRGTELGLTWAGTTTVRQAYDWDPASFLAGVGEANIAGVEAPLWSETTPNLTAAYYLAFPRLPALAEIGWSPQERRQWEGFRLRLAEHAPRWRLLGINFHPSDQVPWPAASASAPAR